MKKKSVHIFFNLVLIKKKPVNPKNARVKNSGTGL